ncbi:unnamed protein product [Orchesella dallaii]|uniref:Calcineurin-binding protein cabin-1 n=1 Tax=Orchesella dallaii TaxID=48710 RepID=A0ABP1RB98_9HEXA
METQSPKTIPTSGEEFFHKLDNLLLSSTYFLHTMFEVRFKTETETHWESTKQNGMRVWNGLSPQISNSIEDFCKILIQEGSLDRWDLSILSEVFQHYGKCNYLYQNQNEGVKSLKRLANMLIKNSKKSLTRKEYNRHLKLFKESLKAFNMGDEKLNKMINSAEVISSSAAWQTVISLARTALNHAVENGYEKSIESLSKAVEVPGLLPLHQSFVFEQRAQGYLYFAQYLKKIEDPEWNIKLEKSIADANKALEITKNYWKAHQIIAKCHKLKGNLKEARSHYERILTMYPGLSKIREEFNACKVPVQTGIRTKTDNVSKISPQKVTHPPEEKNIKEKGGSKSLGNGNCKCTPSSSSSPPSSSSSPSLSSTFKVTIPNAIKITALNETSSTSNASKVVDPKIKVNTDSDVQLRINEANRDLHYLTQLFKNKNNFNKTEHKEIINIMYKSGIDVYETLELDPDMFKKITPVITQLFKSKCEKKIKVGEEDMKIRFIFIGMSLRDNDNKSSTGLQSAMKLAKKGVEMYPENPHFHGLVLDAYTELEDSEEGLRYAEQVLKTIASHEATGILQYMRLTHLDTVVGQTDLERKFKAYCEYLKALPKDHWRVPEMYYNISYYYFLLMDFEDLPEELKKEREIRLAVHVLHYYNRGRAAEDSIHSYFKPRLQSVHKLTISTFLQNGMFDKIARYQLTSELRIELDNGSDIEVWERFSEADWELEQEYEACESQKDGSTNDVNGEQNNIKEEGAEGASHLEEPSESQQLPTEVNLNDESNSLQDGPKPETIVKEPLPLSEEEAPACEQKEFSEIEGWHDITWCIDDFKKFHKLRCQKQTVLCNNVKGKLTKEQIALSEAEIGACKETGPVKEVDAQPFFIKHGPMRQNNKAPPEMARLVQIFRELGAHSLSLMRKQSEVEESAASVGAQADKLDPPLPEAPLNSKQVSPPVIETVSFASFHPPPKFPSNSEFKLSQHVPKYREYAGTVRKGNVNPLFYKAPSFIVPHRIIRTLTPKCSALNDLKGLSHDTPTDVNGSEHSPPPPEAVTTNETASLTEAEVPDESHNVSTANEMETLPSPPPIHEMLANKESEDTPETEANNEFDSSHNAPLTNQLELDSDSENAAENDNIDKEPDSPPPPETTAVSEPVPSSHESPAITESASTTTVDVLTESHNVPTENEMPTVFSAPSDNESLAITESAADNELTLSQFAPSTNEHPSPSSDDDSQAATNETGKSADTEIVTVPYQTSTQIPPAAPSLNEALPIKKSTETLESAGNNEFKSSHDAPSTKQLALSLDTTAGNEATSSPNNWIVNAALTESAANNKLVLSHDAPSTNAAAKFLVVTIPATSSSFFEVQADNEPTSYCVASTVIEIPINATSVHLEITLMDNEKLPSSHSEVEAVAGETPTFMGLAPAEQKSRPDEATALPSEEAPPLTLNETMPTTQNVPTQPKYNNFTC